MLDTATFHGTEDRVEVLCSLAADKHWISPILLLHGWFTNVVTTVAKVQFDIPGW